MVYDFQKDFTIVYQIALDPTSVSANSPGEAVNNGDGISECVETVPLSADSREVDCTDEYVSKVYTLYNTHSISLSMLHTLGV